MPTVKIYNEVVIDMNPESPTFENILHEDSFNYSGDIMFMQIGKPLYRKGQKKSTDFKVGIIDGSPSIQVNWGGRVYSTPLTLSGSGSSTIAASLGRMKVLSNGAIQVEDILLTGKIDVQSFGNQNVCIGTSNSDIGTRNINIGVNAGKVMAGGALDNICIGTDAGYTLSTSDDNVLIGTNAGYSISTGNGDNVLIGRNCGYYVSTGYDNVFIGDSAGKGVSATALTGYENVAIGDLAMYKETVGTANVAIGYQSLLNSQGGDYNIAIGYQAAYQLTDAQNNVAVGYQALYDLTTQDDNVAIGYTAGANITDTGGGNTLIGKSAGDTITTGQLNTCIGYYTDTSKASAYGQTVIGPSVTADNGTLYDGSTTGKYTTTIEGRGGFFLKGGTTAGASLFASACFLTLDTNSTSVAGDHTDPDNSDVIGVIQFRAPDDGTGDAILPCAAIWARAEANFSTTSNECALVFGTSESESALDNERMRISDYGGVFMPVVYGHANAGGRDLYIQSTGQLTYLSSSKVFKENIVSLSNSSILNSLNPVSFTPKDTSGEITYGLIAEEVWEVDENLCLKATEKEKLEYDLETDAIGVNYDALIPVLIKAVQELSVKVDNMDTRLTNLEVV